MSLTLIQGTRRPFTVYVVTGIVDATTVIGVDLYVHRDYQGSAPSTETWTMTIDGVRTTAARLVATYAPTASGDGSVATANEVMKARPVLHFDADPANDIEADPFLITVEER